MASSNATSNGTDLLVYEAPCFIHDYNSIRVVRIAPYAPIFFFAVTGNILVMAVVYKNKSMRKTINFFITNMAFSDLIFTVISIPRVVTILLFGYKWLVHGSLGLIFCRMVPFVMEITIIASVLNIVAITVDRFLAVLFPLRTFISKRFCLFAIFAMWLVAISVEIPTLLATDFDEYQGKTYCIIDLDLKFGGNSGEIYFNFVFVVLYAMPFAVTVVLNLAIIFNMQKRDIPGDTISETSNRNRVKTNRKVIRMVLVVVAAFLLCWSLYFVLMVLRKNGIHVPCDVLYLRLLLAQFNAAFTPLLYAIFSENYRQGFAEILTQIGCTVFVVPRSNSMLDNTCTRSRNSSAINDLRTSLELQTLGTPQHGSTAQLLE